MLFTIIVFLLLLLLLLILFLNKNKTDKFDDINNTVIINFFTKDLCEEWKNHIYTLKKFNLDKYVVVFPLDYDALECVKSENIKYNLDLIDKINVGNSEFDSDIFKKLMHFKILAIKHYIDLNYNVFYLDTDTIIFGDIINDINTYPKDYDFYAQEDENTICAGCMFLLPTKNTKLLIDECDKYFINNWDNIMGNSDQALINKLVKTLNVKYHLLPWEKYASGKQFFEKNSKYFKENTPLFLHNNWIKGLEAKTKRFKDNGFWYV